MYGFGAICEDLESGVFCAKSFELGGFERRSLAENPSRDAGLEVFVGERLEIVVHGNKLLVPSDPAVAKAMADKSVISGRSLLGC